MCVMYLYEGMQWMMEVDICLARSHSARGAWMLSFAFDTSERIATAGSDGVEKSKIPRVSGIAVTLKNTHEPAIAIPAAAAVAEAPPAVVPVAAVAASAGPAAAVAAAVVVAAARSP